MDKKEKISFFNSEAQKRDYWIRKNSYYYKDLYELMNFIIPKGSSVLEIGCGTGELLKKVEPKRGVGIDFSEEMIKIAKNKYPDLSFITMDAENLDLNEKFDYIILSDLIGHLEDIQSTFENLRKVCHSRTKIIITYYNFLWEPILKLGEKFKLKAKQYYQNWLSYMDIENLLKISDFEPIRIGVRLLLPIFIPLISTFLNKYISKFPFFRSLCLVNYIIARIAPNKQIENYSCSVIVPARNESGNIEKAVLEIPMMGRSTEIIFIEGWSKDNTLQEIQRVCEKYKELRLLKWAVQDGIGKKDAVQKGFDIATGDILMILDADLTVSPKDLIKFYNALASGKGEFINGSRMVYPMEKEAMRFLNMVGNKFFSLLFSWILGTNCKDTLCGTKAIFKSDYEKIKQNRNYFGDFDPFGDFDLIFGAYKQNLKMVEIPVHYKRRTYGSSNIHRWKHGFLLLKMSLFAMRKIKFI